MIIRRLKTIYVFDSPVGMSDSLPGFFNGGRQPRKLLKSNVVRILQGIEKEVNYGKGWFNFWFYGDF